MINIKPFLDPFGRIVDLVGKAFDFESDDEIQSIISDEIQSAKQELIALGEELGDELSGQLGMVQAGLDQLQEKAKVSPPPSVQPQPVNESEPDTISNPSPTDSSDSEENSEGSL